MIKLKNLIREEISTLNEIGKDGYSFDLTDIKATHFSKILKSVGINPNSYKSTKDGWVWKGKDIEVVTANNPITGEYYSQVGRPAQKDYASYIGVSGDEEKVRVVVKGILGKADYIKGHGAGRGYI